jgi:hypothetical protein
LKRAGPVCLEWHTIPDNYRVSASRKQSETAALMLKKKEEAEAAATKEQANGAPICKKTF